MNRVSRLIAALLAAALLLTACGSDESTTDDAAPADGEGAVIEIADFAFSGDFDLSPGQTVEVVNNDSAPHTFTAADGSFDTGTIDPGDSVTFTVPDAEGPIDVFCSIHPSMTARVNISS